MSAPANFKLQHVKFKDLVAYADAMAADPSNKTLPISSEHARRLVHNPEARPDDLALVVVLNANGRCIGYMGCLPGILRTPTGDVQVAWLSTAYLEREFRHPDITDATTKAILNTYSCVAATGTTRQTANILRRSGVTEKIAEDTVRVRLACLDPFLLLSKIAGKIARLLPAKVRLPGLATLRDLTRRLIARLLLVPLTVRSDLQTCAFLSPGVLERIESRPPWCFFRRPATLRWMIAEPWNGGGDPRYYFSRPHHYIGYTCFNLRERHPPNHESGFIISKVDGPLRLAKVLDVGAATPASLRLILPIALAEGLRFGADSLVIPKACLEGTLLGRYCRLFSVNMRQLYFLKAQDEQISLNAVATAATVDGDMAFW